MFRFDVKTTGKNINQKIESEKKIKKSKSYNQPDESIDYTEEM